jgi:hypothetical protein
MANHFLAFQGQGKSELSVRELKPAERRHLSHSSRRSAVEVL